MSERNNVVVVGGVPRRVQGDQPVQKPKDALDDCAYCHHKPKCQTNRRSMGDWFYEGEAYPPCGRYEEEGEWCKRDHERNLKLAELKKIITPVARPEGAAPDCLYCARLPLQAGLYCRYGSQQGEEKVCRHYHEVKARPEGEEKKCLFCLVNYNCESGRVLRVGTPCEKYRELQAEGKNL